MNNNLLPIAKEGWSYIFYTLLVFFVLGFFDLNFLQFFVFLSMIFFMYVFRNPERELLNFQDGSVVSPVDGLVSSITEIEGSDDYAYEIEIDSSYFNVSLLRTPLTSEVTSAYVEKGARLSKFSLLGKSINENAQIVFRDNNNNSLRVVHRLKQSFKNIDLQLVGSQKVNQSSRYGLMVNGTTTIFLPKNFRLNIGVGQELKASQSLIGYFTS